METFGPNYYQTGNYVDYLNRAERYGKLAKEIAPVISGSTLDFGCGVGFLVDGLQKIDMQIQGYDISSWAIHYGTEILKIPNLTDQWNDLKPSYETLLGLDVFEHMSILDIKFILHKIQIKTIVARIPVAKKANEDFVLDVSKRDKTHITCMTKNQWDNLFLSCSYSPQLILNYEHIWESEGVLSRVYVKNI